MSQMINNESCMPDLGTKGKAPRRWLRRIEFALFACGVALLAFWGGAQLQSTIASRKAVRDFIALDSAGLTSGDPMRAETGGTSGMGAEFGLRDEQRVSANRSKSVTRHGGALAVLRIPKISLEVPVVRGTDSLTLNYAVGWISGTARPGEQGNIGIAGHRDTFFRGLKDVRVGDSLQLQSSGETAIYVVDGIRIVNPRDVGVLKPRSLATLTLVTCYPFYFVGNAPKRYIVSATLTQKTPVASAVVSPNDFVSNK